MRPFQLKKTKLIPIVTLLTALACGQPPDPTNLCGDLSETGPYDIHTLKLEVIGSPYSSDTISENALVTKDNFFIRIKVDERVFLKISEKRRPLFQIIRTAHACSPAPAYTDEVISEITVVSNSDFSNTKKKGDNLSTLFQVYTADSTANDGTNLPMALPEYVNNHFRSGYLLGIELLENPSLGKNHVFTITYKHEGGETFTLTTSVINFE